jgi:uncharacterized MAPEG superfamily protein
MTVPVAAALVFAGWTLAVLLGTVGVYRWSRILTGRARLNQFRADQIEGEDWYRRAMRAHANCVENLPVFAVIVFAAQWAGVHDMLLSWFALTVVVTRVPQTLIHILLAETNLSVGARFGFYIIQILAMLAMIGVVASAAA